MSLQLSAGTGKVLLCREHFSEHQVGKQILHRNRSYTDIFWSTMTLLLGCLITACLSSVLGEQEVPETIFLPYSETEDVDFTIDRPSRVGCYQW